jgi:hypothetical protein
MAFIPSEIISFGSCKTATVSETLLFSNNPPPNRKEKKEKKEEEKTSKTTDRANGLATECRHETAFCSEKTPRRMHGVQPTSGPRIY